MAYNQNIFAETQNYNNFKENGYVNRYEEYNITDFRQENFYGQVFEDAQQNDEETEKLNDLKSMPTTLGEKIRLKRTFQDLITKTDETSKKSKLTSIKKKFTLPTLWKHDLKYIELHYGTNIKMYFIFIKYLIFLNLIAFILTFGLVVVPSIFDGVDRQRPTFKFSPSVLLDLFQGTGILENTALFYGYYSDVVFKYAIRQHAFIFSIPLAYLLTFMFYLFFCIVLLSYGSAKQFNESNVLLGTKYSELIFARWPFTTNSQEYAIKNHKAVMNDYISTLEVNKREDLRRETIRNNNKKIIAFRIIANTFVIAILVGSATGVYFSFMLSMQQIEVYKDDRLLLMFYQFLPSLTIVVYNKIVPVIFRLFIKYEFYNENVTLRLNLLRMVFLRMFSLCILYYTLFTHIDDECWETKIGQQMYKLAITEFVTHILTTYILSPVLSNFKFLASDFDLPKNVLDIVFLQTICWFGSYYTPLLPLIFTIIFYFMFFVKLYACSLANNTMVIVHRTGKQSKSMFLTVLLMAMIFAIIPIIYSIGELTPSATCGSFKGKTIAWDVVTEGIKETASWAKKLLYALTSAGFLVPFIFLLCVFLYYYFSLLSGNEVEMKQMKKEIKSVRANKRYLRKIYKRLQNKTD